MSWSSSISICRLIGFVRHHNFFTSIGVAYCIVGLNIGYVLILRASMIFLLHFMMADRYFKILVTYFTIYVAGRGLGDRRGSFRPSNVGVLVASRPDKRGLVLFPLVFDFCLAILTLGFFPVFSIFSLAGANTIIVGRAACSFPWFFGYRPRTPFLLFLYFTIRVLVASETRDPILLPTSCLQGDGRRL